MHTPVDICIVTPQHPSLNPRVVKEADSLSEAGYRVAVIAPDFSAWAREADKEFDGRRWKLVERPQFGPNSPKMIRIAELARRAFAGFAVKTLGVYHAGIVEAAWHPVTPQLVTAASRHKARLYIAHYPAALPAAAIAAAKHGARYAYDAEDFHPGDLPNAPQHVAQNRMVRLIERRHLPGSAYVTAAAPGIADAYVAEYGIARPTIILNSFPRIRAAAAPSGVGSVTPRPSIYWFSQTIGPGRGVECAIKAAALAAARPHLYLRGKLAVGFGAQLNAIAQSAGMADRLHILAPESPHRMESLAAQYDVGYSGETGFSPNNNLALGNKLFSYLLAGVPILLSDTDAHRAFARELGLAARLFPVNMPESLAAAIDSLLLDDNALAKARNAAWHLGQERFNWEVDSERLVAIVRSVLELGRRPMLTSLHG